MTRQGIDYSLSSTTLTESTKSGDDEGTYDGEDDEDANDIDNLGPLMVQRSYLPLTVVYNHTTVKNQAGEEYYVKNISLPFPVNIVYFVASYWDWIMMIQICLSYGCVTYSFFFAPYLAKLSKAIWFLDMIYGIDSLTRILIEFWRRQASIPCIIYGIPYSLYQCILDILSLVPLEVFYIRLNPVRAISFFNYYGYFQLNRLLRFSRAFTFTSVVVSERRLSAKLMFVITYMAQYFIFLHFIACFLYCIASPPTASFSTSFYFLILTSAKTNTSIFITLSVWLTQIFVKSPIDFLLRRELGNLYLTWMKDVENPHQLHLNSHFDHYSICVSFAACVLTTTGYGDFSGRTAFEMALLSLSMLIGAIIISGFFSSGLASFQMDVDGARFDLFFRVDAIMNYLVRIKCHTIYMDKVLEYYKLLWNYREGVYDVHLISELPRSFVEDTYYDICSEMFHKTPLFRGLDASFLREIAAITQIVIHNPKMLLCTSGSYALNMYYIFQGEVMVQSKSDTRQSAAILRAGCVIGEVNLFFSYPYTSNYETITCCQMLQLNKTELYELFERRKDMLELLRNRVAQRLQEAHDDYTMAGHYPICWVEKNDQDPMHIQKPNFPVIVRSGRSWNNIVTKDVIDDSVDTMIVEMPCLDASFAKKHIVVYGTCVIPPILEGTGWLFWWNTIVMTFSIYSAISGPYCIFFNPENELMVFLCVIDPYLEISLCLIYAVDIIFEIIYSCPVSGLYYRIKDGLQLNLNEPSFWLDTMSLVPLTLSFVNDPLIHHVGVTVRVIRLYKLIRYFNYLDNVYPANLFAFRVLRALFSIVYSMHLVACYLYGFACYTIEGTSRTVCNDSSWLGSFVSDKTGSDATLQSIILGKKEGYWSAFYFACATVTTTGFGDFTPQSTGERLFLAFIQLAAFCVMGYYTALLTSALSCTVRPKLVFQQRLIGVRQFLIYKGLTEHIQKRVIEHYYLQDQLWNGVNLPDDTFFYMYDTPLYLHEDAIYLEVELHFDGVPIFTVRLEYQSYKPKIDPKVLVEITKLMRRYLVPPGTIFTRKGEVRRQMYVIGRGSVAVMMDTDKNMPLQVIDETGHFGIRDLLFGEPAHHDIKTLTYCLLYEVELRDLLEAFRYDSELLRRVDNEKDFLQAGIDAMITEFAYRSNPTPNQPAHEIPSFISFPKNEDDSLPHCSYQEYKEVFRAIDRPEVFQRLLMRRAIHPAGSFAKIWVCLMSLRAAIVIGVLFETTFTGRNRVILIACCDFVSWVDIYLKLHWAYFTKKNLLVSHPLKTATSYIWNGEFIVDVLISIPMEWIVNIAGYMGSYEFIGTYGWSNKFRWNRFGQIVHIPAAVKVFHTIFTMRNFLLLVFYISITVFICTVAACIAESLVCPVGQALYTKGDEDRLPFCKQGSYITRKDETLLETATQRWIIGLYYISQTMFSIGYGEMTTTSVNEMKVLIIVAVAGFTIVRCILADITSAEVDIDEVRHQYYEQLLCLEIIMHREQVPKKFRTHVVGHMYHTWKLSKGLQPRQLFRDLHRKPHKTRILAELFRELVGDDLKRVPIFRGFRENVLRTICQVMITLYFQTGDRITRYGNMERLMFVIVSGKVWIADKQLRWKHTLFEGESFGECSIIHGTRRSYNVVAASNVELFVLSEEDFSVVIQRYPTVLDEMKSRVPNPTFDIFRAEGPIRSERLSYDEANKVSDQIRILLERITIPDPDESAIYQKVRQKLGLRIFVALFGIGNQDKNLPFLYFTKCYDFRWLYLFHGHCSFILNFHTLFVHLCYVSPLLAAYNITFVEELPSPVGEALDFLTHIIEIPMWLHLIVQFITTFRQPDETHCREWSKILHKYFWKFPGFPIDLISNIPIFPKLFGDKRWRYLRVIRFLRLIHFYRYHLSKADDLDTSIIRYKVTLSMSAFGIVIHGIACIFYYIASCSCTNVHHPLNLTCTDAILPLMCPPMTWTHEYIITHDLKQLRRLQPWRWWVRSTYWVVTTMSTTGFGDITPINEKETMLAIFTIFCGAFILSIILSHFAAGISSLTKTYREYSYQVELLLKHIANMGASEARLDTTSSYFAKKWESCRGRKYHECTAVLPSTMNTELCYLLYEPVASKNKLFSYKLNTTFMRQLCGLFRHDVYIPGVNIVNCGYLEKLEAPKEGKFNTVGTLFLLFKGRIAAYGFDSTGNQLLVQTYSVGDLFGQYSAFFYDLPFNKNYRAETYVEILSITQNEVIELTEQFPQFAQNVNASIAGEYGHIIRPNIFMERTNEKTKDGDEVKVNAGMRSVDLPVPKEEDKTSKKPPIK